MSSVVRDELNKAIALKRSDEEGVRLARALDKAKNGIAELQHPEGYWSFELEADCSIPSEYILMMHYMDEIDLELERKIGVFLRARQMDDGGWPQYTGGVEDLSCTIKCYYALKLIGDNPDAPHMQRARALILSHGGAARANVFSRITLALFEQVPWHGVPFIPVEIMLLPKWFPFHYTKVSYWSRVVMVPLFVLTSLRAKARNPRKINIRELFTVPPEDEQDYFPIRSRLNLAFYWLDRIGRLFESFVPAFVRRRAIRKAEKWFTDRINGEEGLGAIFPAMVNAYEAMDLLGYERDHSLMQLARNALQKMLVIEDDHAYCQPCVSPIWDTAWSCIALQETCDSNFSGNIESGLDWLKSKQLLDAPGDWRDYRPNLPGGGWPFQFANDYYPDLDDTAAVAVALLRAKQPEKYEFAIKRAADWLVGMQSRNGGFASFDADNTYYYLNEIPFADHGALLDPPTADVTARVIWFLLHYGRSQDRKAVQRAISYLTSDQEGDGSWFGRWGTNYVYGTWSTLLAFELNTEGFGSIPNIRKAVNWLKSHQREDGGWGEDNDTYLDKRHAGSFRCSTPYHTAWSLLGLMAAGEVGSEVTRGGVEYLLNTQGNDGLWHDEWFNAPGFPRVFYLRYHGYMRFFPLWALARYQNLIGENA